jgi:hypothetical protein
MAIRQLEFDLMQLSQQLDDLSTAIQCIISGKLPVRFIDPATLQNILRNVTLKLPDGYELIVGTKTENIHLYYQLANVSMVANANYIKLIVNVPLRTPANHFALYKIITLPERVSVVKFIQYSVEFSYLGLQTGQRGYILLSQTEFNQCDKGDVTLCPAVKLPVSLGSSITIACVAMFSIVGGVRCLRALCCTWL